MSLKLSDKKLAVLGTGKLGGILLRAYLKQGLFSSNQVTATVKHPEKAAALTKELGIAVTTDNREAVKGADIVLLTIKPQTVAEVLQEIAPEICGGALLVSVAASVPTGFLEQQLAATTGGKRDEVPVVRAMPNTPAAVDCGMTAICAGTHAKTDHLEIARTMFDAVGRTIVVDEKHMDAVTGLSASGPAFAYIILESLAEAGVKVGLPRDERRGKRCVGNGRSSRASQRRRDYSRGLHYRRHSRARGRQASRHAHQSGREGYEPRRRTAV
jgi:pyrroline-5-carboxylate reductase